jgi:ligand-binding sensor domain-containing protein
MNLNRYSCLFLLFFCLPALAQVPAVQRYSTQDLGDFRFTTVYQASDGWLWLGGQNAVYRFDGQVFMPVKFPEGVPSGPVGALYESGGKLWVGFRNGTIAFLPNVNSGIPMSTGDVEEDLRHAPALTLWAPEEGLPKVPITGITEDKQGARWIGTYGEGVYVWKNNRLFQYNHADDDLVSDDVYALARDAEGRIWAATDGGISICTMPEAGHKTVENLTAADGLPDEIITALAADKLGNIWAGTDEKGAFRYNITTKTIDRHTLNWHNGPVTGLAVFGENDVWIGTEKSGLIRFDALTSNMTKMPLGHPLAAAKMRVLGKDREGLLWALADRGVLYSANVRFGMVPTPCTTVQAIYTDARGQIWIGGRSGLFCQKGRDFVSVLSKKENIVSIWVSPLDGVVWAGSLGNGVFLIHPSGRVLRHLPERETRVNGSVLSIAGNRDRVWLATLGGVSVLNPQTLKPVKGIDLAQLGSNYVYKVLEDTRGRVWFGTDGKGLVVYENGIFHAYSQANGVALRTIYSIVEDRAGDIWFSTARDGLFRFDGQQFKRFTTTNHLHSMAITGLAVDGNNQVVIGYEDGFDVLNQDRFDHISFFGGAPQAPSVAVNLNAMWTDARGRVWMSADGGMVQAAAYQESVVSDPQPSITGVSVFQQPIDFLHNTVFSHDQNYFLFNFIGLWYSNPELVRYRYRLEGFDPAWKISKDHTASYPKLPPGAYTFRVQTSEHGNFFNVPEATWSFRIGAPFWLSWWFFGMIFALLGGLIWGYISVRERRLQGAALLKREKVESQFEALKSQINPHFLFNSFNTLIAIIEENPVVAVEYVEHLADFYRSIIVYRERDLISVAEEIALVRSFDFLLKKRYEDGFHLVYRVQNQEGRVMPLSLQILVENAVKHNVIARSKPLTVEIFREDGFIVVRNNLQRKIKPEASTHFGLYSLVNRYKLLGERSVVVEESTAFFTVKIPIL